MDLKLDNIRLRLIKYAVNPSITEHEEQLKHTELDSEREVMKILQSQGYKVQSQWKVGLYRIDMVVEDGDKRIALECDGERWHTLHNLADYMKRQAILERLGWRLIWIRGSQFYKKPDKTMEWVFDELDSYDIRPNYLDIGEILDEDKVVENKLFSRIKRSAERIRFEWHGGVEENEEIIEEGANN